MRKMCFRVALTAVLVCSFAGKSVCFPAYGIVCEGEWSESWGEEDSHGSDGESDGEKDAEGPEGEGGGADAESPEGESGGEEDSEGSEGENGGGEEGSEGSEGENGREEEGSEGSEGENGGEEDSENPEGEKGEGGEDSESPEGECEGVEDAESPEGKGEGEEDSEDPDEGIGEGEIEAPDSGQIDDNQKGDLQNPEAIQQPEIPLQMIVVPEDEKGCSTPEELLELLESGEEVCLTGDIFVSEGEYLDIFLEDEAAVDMNGYSIIVSDEAQLSVRGPIRFQGPAEDRALFQISGRATFKGGAEVWAEGDGAIAVEISGAADKYVLETDNAFIGVSGDDSIALKWTGRGRCSLEYVHIEAEGENSVGIDSERSVELRLCLVEAEGSSVVTDKEIIADASEITPFPKQCQVITREISIDNRLDENGVSVKAGADWEELYDRLAPVAPYAFYDPYGVEETWTKVFSLGWSGLPEDLSEPGSYRAVIEAEGYPDWFFKEIPDTEVIIYVVAPDEAHIQEIFRMEDLVVFRLLSTVEDAQRLLLLCSADGGDSWQDAGSMPGCSVEIDALTITLEGLEINHTYLFRLSVTGGPMEGLSSVKAFSFYENDSDRFGHGDRDGDDRDDQGELPPWDSAPPPDKDFGNSGTSSSSGTVGSLADDEAERPQRETLGIFSSVGTELLGAFSESVREALNTSGADAEEMESVSGTEETCGVFSSPEEEYTEEEISLHSDSLKTESLIVGTAAESKEEAVKEITDSNAGSPESTELAGFLLRTGLGAAAGIVALSWYKGKSRRKP